ncbi:(2Fe-2S)-binding protein [Intrasporangium calvum]|uniref:(2Fe-2S)-binding protein n=1 Tax=Intrasporangium calvum TaxID=53358 RepID=A0ABT5GFS3_9MICO|nr:(2Fe-2S)-binding protein [Intrasporangium calvum]MDC5697054.1 (2Fe-2S)-binding protein [Intrasporangium calvum]
MSTFRFDDVSIPFRDGQSVGAALVAQGILSWRTTRLEGRPRGLFCGIGICFDCLVTVDGVPSQRACLVRARDGLDVTTQEGSGYAAE